MATTRPFTDFPRSEAGLVDNMIGTAYDTVKLVADNLETLDAIVGLASSIDQSKADAEQAASTAITMANNTVNTLQDVEVLRDEIANLILHRLTMGTVQSGVVPAATITGDYPEQKLNLVLPELPLESARLNSLLGTTLRVVQSRAAAVSLANTLTTNTVIEVLTDENYSNARTRYWAIAGTLNFIVNMDSVTNALNTFVGQLQSPSGASLVMSGAQSVEEVLTTLKNYIVKLQSPATGEGSALVKHGAVSVKTAIDNLAAAQTSGTFGFATVADLESVDALAIAPGGLAIVTNDAVVGNNTVWRKTGAIGVTGWTKSGDDRISQLDAEYKAADVTLQSQIDSIGFTEFEPNVKDKDGKDVVFALTDSNGKAAMHINSEGNIRLGNLAVDTNVPDYLWAIMSAIGVPLFGEKALGEFTLANVDVDTSEVSNVAFAICDETGRAALLIQTDGTVVIPKSLINPPEITPPEVSLVKPFNNQNADYRHVVVYGQSLSKGFQSLPVITTTQPYLNLTFQSGVLPKNPGDVDYSSFKPLIEQAVGDEGESPTSSLVNDLTKKQLALGGSAAGSVYIGTSPGTSGEAIDNLSKGTTNYLNMITQITSAKSLSQAAGKSYVVWNMAWAQGESDSLYSMTQETYKTKLIKLKNDFASDCRAITKQHFNPPMVTYQMAAHRKMGNMDNAVARAQWQASREDADIVLACPVYPLEHAPDKLHLSNEGSRQLGFYFSKALHQSLLNGIKWKPVEPTAVLWQDRLIDITFNVPTGSLVFDTTLVASTPNMGFDIWESGVCVTGLISGVVIEGGNRVKLSLTRSAASTAVLTYAKGRVGDAIESGPLTGPRGNLRDIAGDSDYYTDASSNIRKMHNWCVMFAYKQDEGII